MKRSITHWTAGAPKASNLDLNHYHLITEHDGTYVKGREDIADNVVTSDGDYAAHTRNLNTDSMGLAMAGMHDAVESPFDPGPYPIMEHQFERHCALVAQKHVEYGIPITEETCLTHAEVEPRLGVKQAGKWDLTRLVFKPELVGAFPVGDYMRERVRHYVTEITGYAQIEEVAPTLRVGSRGEFVRDLQTQLRNLGYTPGDTDGQYGERTKEAVMVFQANNGLMNDGIVGPQTWNSLVEAQPRPLRNVSEKDLEKRGSRTIKNAKKVEKTMTSAEVVAGGGLSVGAVVEVAKSAQGAEGALEMAQRMFFEYWPILLIAFAVFVVARYGKQVLREIRQARVEDAQTGRNLSR